MSLGKDARAGQAHSDSSLKHLPSLKSHLGHTSCSFSTNPLIVFITYTDTENLQALVMTSAAWPSSDSLWQLPSWGWLEAERGLFLPFHKAILAQDTDTVIAEMALGSCAALALQWWERDYHALFSHVGDSVCRAVPRRQNCFISHSALRDKTDFSLGYQPTVFFLTFYRTVSQEEKKWYTWLYCSSSSSLRLF